PVSPEFRGTISVSILSAAGICSGPWKFMGSPAAPFLKVPVHQLKPGLYYAVIRQGQFYLKVWPFSKR
ncbi:MAG: hypothetical protein ACKO6K_04220, partial [Chitinophagaceae bacterium]